MFKIYIVSPYESVLSLRGNRLPTISKILSDKGFVLEYLTTNFNHGDKKHYKLNYIKNKIKKVDYSVIIIKNIGYKNNISFKRLISHLSFSIKIFILLILKLKKRDIVIIQSRPSEMIFFSTWVSIIKRSKIIMDVTDIWPEAFPEGKMKIFVKLYCELFQILSIPLINNYIYTTKSYKIWINKYSNKSNISYIPLGYDDERWKTCKPIDTINGIIKIIYIGQITPNIDILPLIKAMKYLPNYSLTILGLGDLIEDIKYYVKINNINNVIFLGFLKEEEFIETIINHHITVIPMVGMIGGIFPNKAFDAIGSYKPMLVYGKNDLSTFVKNNNIGWKLPFDYVKTINLLKSISKEEIINKSHNIELIRIKHSKKHLSLKYLKFINKIAKLH